MDKRFFIALVLTALVIVGLPLLAPDSWRAPATVAGDTTAIDGRADSAMLAGAAAPPPTTVAAAANRPAAQPADRPAMAPLRGEDGATISAADSTAAVVSAAVRAETTSVATPLSTYRFSSVGAAPVGVEMRRYRSLRPTVAEAPVDLARAGEALLRYRLVTPGDTISLHDVPFRVSRGAASASGVAPIIYDATVGDAQLRIAYSFLPDSYQVHVASTVRGAPARSFLLLDFGSGLRSEEADASDDLSHLAFAYKPTRDDASSIAYRKLDPGEARLAEGPLTWAVQKNKYFVFGVLAPEGGTPLAELQVTGGPRTGKNASNAAGTAVLPLGGDGQAAFTIYAGPQEWRRLLAVGHDFENVNPYGGWLQGVVQPFATIVMRVLLWLKGTTHLSYGWVLVIFGVGVRLAMWPLNQSAMRSQLKMQRVQPEVEAARKRHGSDMPKQQEEIMKVYKAHGMSPFSPLAGCLPMLLPMPILFALFYVFQNTIEFRGVPFLWLHDISVHDPHYITPILMGLTTFIVSWIGMRAAPQNPQTKMLAYVMPLAFTAMFARLAAGLHIYYTVQNLAAIPQQWLIANERAKAMPAKPVVEGTPRSAPPSTPAPVGRRR